MVLYQKMVGIIFVVYQVKKPLIALQIKKIIILQLKVFVSISKGVYIMKIILNKCYGGFDVSDKAYELYAEKRGISIYRYWDDYKNKANPP